MADERDGEAATGGTRGADRPLPPGLAVGEKVEGDGIVGEF